MATGYLLPISTILQFFTDQGVVLAGGKVCTYVAGTTTPVATYTSSSLSVAQANPIILQSNGRMASPVWVPGGVSVKMVLQDSSGNVISGGTIDNLSGINDPSFLTQSAIGAVLYPQTAVELSAGITPTNYAYPFGNVLRYGAKNDGVTDNTVAMTVAHSMGINIYYPAGTYKFTYVTIPGGGIIGSNQNDVILQSTDISGVAKITLSGTGAYSLSEFSLKANDALCSGITFSATSNGSYCLFQRLSFLGSFAYNLNFNNAWFYQIVDCIFQYAATANVKIENDYNPDYGDSVIDRCVFGISSGATGIVWVSGGGLRITNNKMLSGSCAINFNPGAAPTPYTTADLAILNNSIENQSGIPIVLGNVTSGYYITDTRIIGNEIGTTVTGNSLISVGTNWIGGIIEGNNLINYDSSGGIGISLSASTQEFVIGSNAFRVMATAVSIASGATNNVVNLNSYQAVTNHVSNSSSSTDIETVTLSGTATCTYQASYGSLGRFQSSSISFPKSFNAIPSVTCSVADTVNGGISAFPISVSKGSFLIEAIGVNTSGSINCTWIATGIM